MSKLQFCIILMAAAILPLAAQMARVTATPRWPWNGLVDITFSIHENIVLGDGTPAVFDVKLAGYDHDRNRSILMKSFSFDGEFNAAGLPLAESGKTYKVIWDAKADYPTLNASAFSVSATIMATINYYRVVNLMTGVARISYTPPDLSDETCRTTELWLRWVPAGTFTMGSPDNELGRYSNETQHQVTLTKGYYIGVFEVTQKQWELVMGSNPSQFKGDTRPVENVSYEDIRGSNLGAGWPSGGHAVDSDSFLGKLRAKTGGVLFDLPTEAQWEYACRAGTTTALNSGKNLTNKYECPNMAEVGRYYYNRSDGRGGYSQHTKVGSYLPNVWGLYDMHGNMQEWCLDWYGVYYPTESVGNPTGTASGSRRVLRGGYWYNSAQDCRSASRNSGSPSDSYDSYGFRVVCGPPGR